MNSAIKTQLQTYLHENPQTVKAAISEHLDRVLPTLLPDILETLLAGASITKPASRGASSISVESRRRRTHQSPLQALLVQQLHLRYKKQLRRELETVAEEQCDWLHSVVYDIRAEASAEVKEEVEDGIFDLEMIKKDIISDLEAAKEEFFSAHTTRSRGYSGRLGRTAVRCRSNPLRRYDHDEEAAPEKILCCRSWKAKAGWAWYIKGCRQGNSVS